VNWKTVCLPKQGGLGILNPHLHSIALRMRWLWQQHTNPSRPWIGFHIPIDNLLQQCLKHQPRSLSLTEGQPCSRRITGFKACPFAPFPNFFKHSRGRNISVRDAQAWPCLGPLHQAKPLPDSAHCIPVTLGAPGREQYLSQLK
jgi:hypothetical protein